MGQHVWVRQGSGDEVPGQLVSWENRNGTWWGRVAMIDADGDPSLADIVAGLLRPADTAPDSGLDASGNP